MERISSGCGRREFSCKRVEYQVVASVHSRSHRDERPHGILMRGAPLSNPFFRPEEKHVVSGENNVVPPPGGGNKTMKKPVAGWRTFQINLQVQRFTGLLAARMNLPRAMQRRRYAE